jgi:hypothetical protein
VTILYGHDGRNHCPWNHQLREYVEFGPPIHVNLQAGSLHNAINLHLTSSVQSRQPYRIDVRIIDSVVC